MSFHLFLDRAFKSLKLRRINRLFRTQVIVPKGERPLKGDVILYNTNITLGHNVHIYPGVFFWGDGPIVIGDNVDIGKDTILYSSRNGGIYIGADTQIAAHCYLVDMDHGIKKGIPIRIQDNICEKIVIGKDVWIAAGVQILKGSKIQDGAVIGAGAVVKGSIPENAIAVGIPARVLKYRE